ncbi:MAG: magnesium-translocating P-type ATPase [Bacilli bacterium]|jgi:Mg2+-importing ATPase
MDKKNIVRVKKNAKTSSNENLKRVAMMDKMKLFKHFSSSPLGLKGEDIIEEQRSKHGNNKFSSEKKKSGFRKFLEAFLNPFTGILFVIAAVSFTTDVVLADPNSRNYVTCSIIVVLVLFSGVLRFVQELKSSKAMDSLLSMIETTTAVMRDGITKEIPIDEVVVGDIIHLTAGDIVPCDGRIIDAKDLFITQAALTGESEPAEKSPVCDHPILKTITDVRSLVFMGTTVLSGSANMIAIQVGKNTILGETAKTLTVKVPPTSFEKGIKSISLILIYFMVVMATIVLLINGFLKNNWLSAFLFAISVAVGLTPEMLPMIVTTCLAKGATLMAKKKVIIKKLDSIQNFGAMDILCTDKTGTLTQDQVVLEQHLDVHGQDDTRVLRHAFLNAYYQTGLKNILDLSIINKTNELSAKFSELKALQSDYQKVDEIPFDFARRRMSVVVKNKMGKVQVITKGAVEEIINICSFVEYHGKVEPLTADLKKEIFANVAKLNANGMRVIAVAQKTNPAPVGTFSVKDEEEMVLIGYLTFLDPAKPSAKAAIKELLQYGVNIKILTGDNEIVTQRICQDVGLNAKSIMLGSEVDELSDSQLKLRVDETVIFAKLLPEQKARVVRLLKAKGHVVGYMGDGINDAPAMREADIGISVDSAVDIAKESADVILLEKNLNVLKEGLIEGRKVYNNLMKYIKITASSNFGNMLSVVIASIMLPFLPMLPVQLILLNMIYDISCTALPWDNVDPEYLLQPRKWEAKDIVRFVFSFGPISSIFDITTFVMLFYIFGPMAFGGSYDSLSIEQQFSFAMLFQTGWFIESIWTQLVVIHILRSKRFPLVQSKAAPMVYFFTVMIIIFSSLICYIPYVSEAFHLWNITPIFFLYVIGVVVVYALIASLVKMIYVKKHPSFL